MIARPAQSGFSLVELSIVLVILGLLTGGILAGQSLIRAAELRSVSADIQRYSAAVYSFRDKYFALPGDMINATSFWGDQATGTGACASAATADGAPGTCNGNGDGMVADSTNEMFRFWQHLANAGLVEGQYSGIAGPANSIDSIPGTNVPRARISNAGFSFSFVNSPGDAAAYAMNYGNTFWFGAANSGDRTHNIVLKPEEAWNVDVKADDGLAARGKVIARTGFTWGNAASCTTSTSFSDFAGTYRLDYNGTACALMSML